MQNISHTNCQCHSLTKESNFEIYVPCENKKGSRALLVCQKLYESHMSENAAWRSKKDENIELKEKCVIPLMLDLKHIKTHNSSRNGLERCILRNSNFTDMNCREKMLEDNRHFLFDCRFKSSEGVKNETLKASKSIFDANFAYHPPNHLTDVEKDTPLSDLKNLLKGVEQSDFTIFIITVVILINFFCIKLLCKRWKTNSRYGIRNRSQSLSTDSDINDCYVGNFQM